MTKQEAMTKLEKELEARYGYLRELEISLRNAETEIDHVKRAVDWINQHCAEDYDDEDDEDISPYGIIREAYDCTF